MLIKHNYRIKTILLVLSSIVVTICACSESNENLSEQEYEDICRDIPVNELTENADDLKGELVVITGDVVVYYEESDDDGRITSLIIGVEDESNTLPSGQLPVYISYQGLTAAFINDNITVYGEVFGTDICPSPQVQDSDLPRIDARFIDLN